MVYNTKNSENVLDNFYDFKPKEYQRDQTKYHISADLARDDISFNSYKIIPVDLLEGTEEKELNLESIEISKKNIKNNKEYPIIAEWKPTSEEGEDLVLHILDGHHRIEAYKELEIKDIPVAIVESFDE